MKQLDRDDESQHSGQKSNSSQYDEEWLEGSVIRKVRDHHQTCEVLCSPPAGNPDRPITNQRPYNQESLVRELRHFFYMLRFNVITITCAKSVHLCVCMQQGGRKHGSSSQYLGPSQITLFQHTSCEKDKEEEQMTEPESLFQMAEMSNDRKTKIEVYVKTRRIKSESVVQRLKMIAALTNPHSEGDQPHQTSNRPAGGGRDTKG